MNEEYTGEAVQCLVRWQDAFNNRDLEGMLREMHFPHYRISSDNVFNVWETSFEFSQNHHIMTKALDSEGWIKTVTGSIDVFQSDLNKVHIGIKPSRINSIGESYNSFESLWIVTKLDNTWGIQFRSSFLSNAAEHHKLQK